VSGSAERTEQPTPERLRRLRREGKVPRSQDLAAAASLLVLTGVVAASAPGAAAQLRGLLELALSLAASPTPAVALTAIGGAGLRALVLVSGPVLLAAVLVAVAAGLGQVGFLLSFRPLVPDPARLDPASGLGQLLSLRKLVELARSLVKLLVLGWLAWVELRGSLRELGGLGRAGLPAAARFVASLLVRLSTEVGAAFLVLAVADWLYQRRRWLRDQRMTRQEVKDEYRQAEGDPQHRAERRRLHQELVESVRLGVAGADVVVRNPTHLAVALRWDEASGEAPRVVAKGREQEAQRLLARARRHGVPEVRDVPLARALARVDLGDEIPEELFVAVAEVLTLVRRLAAREDERRRARAGRMGYSRRR
jgi:flagellar biosynthetic protein FlhB